MNKLIFSILFTVATAGCGGNTKSVSSSANLACTGENWDQIGYDTAMSGKSVRTFDRYKDFCGDQLEAGAQDKYLDGYTRAVVEFCTYDKGYEYGSAAKDLPEVCPYEIRANFVKGYNQGVRDYQEIVKRMEHRTDRLERESLDGLKDRELEETAR